MKNLLFTIILLTQSLFIFSQVQVPASNFSCWEDFDKNCTTTPKSFSYTSPNPIDICQEVPGYKATADVTLRWYEINCNGKIVISGADLDAKCDYISTLNPSVKFTYYNNGQHPNVFWREFLAKNLSSNPNAGNQVFLHKSTSCYSKVNYTIDNGTGCSKAIGTGKEFHVVSNPPGKMKFEKFIPCEDESCCLGLATLNPDGTILNVEIVNSSLGDCGSSPMLNKYMYYYTYSYLCPKGTYTINSVGPCVSSNDCSFDMSGDYSLEKSVKEKETTLSSDMIKIYPVPVKDKLYVEFNPTITNISIVDVMGKIVLNPTVDAKFIDMSNLPNGNYFITAKDANKKSITKQFIKE